MQCEDCKMRLEIRGLIEDVSTVKVTFHRFLAKLAELKGVFPEYKALFSLYVL